MDVKSDVFLEKCVWKNKCFSWTFPALQGPGPGPYGPYGPIWSDFWSNLVRFGSKIKLLTKFLDDSAWLCMEKLKNTVLRSNNQTILQKTPNIKNNTYYIIFSVGHAFPPTKCLNSKNTSWGPKNRTPRQCLPMYSNSEVYRSESRSKYVFFKVLLLTGVQLLDFGTWRPKKRSEETRREKIGKT